jgi:alkylation response protein AidB-like acyl-CoA dehydrogenase
MTHIHHEGPGPACTWNPLTLALGLDTLFTQIAEEAPHRDVQRDHPRDRIEALKAQGFGRLRLPMSQGGRGITLPDLLHIVQDLACADPNVAHAFRNHFFAVEEALRAPTELFYGRLLHEAALGHTFGAGFGIAPTPRAGAIGAVTGQLQWNEQLRAYLGSGSKGYSTGNLYADWLLGPAVESRAGRQVRYLISTRAAGVDLTDDWSGFGQKLTGSGTTRFERARVEPGDIYPSPAPAAHNGTWGYTFHQIYLTTLIAGIARRAVADAVQLLRQRSRNYYHGQAEEPRHEPVLQAHLGRIAAQAAAIEALTRRAGQALDTAFAAYGTPEASSLTLDATLKAMEAKILADALAPQLTSELLDLGSGSVVTAEKALDRHWRNAKVIAAHNPRLYKERMLGDYLLNGTLPPTGAYF